MSFDNKIFMSLHIWINACHDILYCRSALMTPRAPIHIPGTQPTPRWSTTGHMYQQNRQYMMMSASVQNYAYAFPQQQMYPAMPVVAPQAGHLIWSSEIIRSQQMMGYMTVPGGPGPMPIGGTAKMPPIIGPTHWQQVGSAQLSATASAPQVPAPTYTPQRDAAQTTMQPHVATSTQIEATSTQTADDTKSGTASTESDEKSESGTGTVVDSSAASAMEMSAAKEQEKLRPRPVPAKRQSIRQQTAKLQVQNQRWAVWRPKHLLLLNESHHQLQGNLRKKMMLHCWQLLQL